MYRKILKLDVNSKQTNMVEDKLNKKEAQLVETKVQLSISLTSLVEKDMEQDTYFENMKQVV